MSSKQLEVVLGIDPGATGAIAAVAIESGELIGWEAFDDMSPARIITGVIHNLRLTGFAPMNIFLERVASSPLMGVVSAFSFGKSFGECAAAAYLGLSEPILITPQGWQKRLPDASGPKERVKAFCESKWTLDAFIAPRCRTPHQGAMDAACIAEFGRSLMLSGVRVDDRKLISFAGEKRRRANRRKPIAF